MAYYSLWVTSMIQCSPEAPEANTAKNFLREGLISRFASTRLHVSYCSLVDYVEFCLYFASTFPLLCFYFASTLPLPCLYFLSTAIPLLRK